MNRRRAPWLVPAVVPLVLAAIVLFPTAAAGGQHPKLPPRTAVALIADALNVKPTGLSGTFDVTVRLGLPELPADSRTASSLAWANFLSGSHSFNIWYADPDHFRIGLLGQLSESEIIRAGSDLWIYRSAENSVSHSTLPTRTPMPSALPFVPTDPATLARVLLDTLAPTARVNVDATEWVAGLPSYTLVVTPNQPGSLISSIKVAIASSTGLPIRVQVFGRDRARPAISIGFTKIIFATPASSMFAFRPPIGASRPASTGSPLTPGSGTPGVTTLGTGWTTILRVTGFDATNELFRRSARSVPQGRLLTTSLLTVLVTPDGTIYAGAVTPELLLAAAAK